MLRAEITLKTQQAYRYTDSIHRAIVEALAAAGATTADLVGANAKPWTFAAQGEDLRGERSLLRYLTISTSDPHLSSLLEKLDTARIVSSSDNGDKIDCAGASLSFMTAQGLPIDNALTVNFASPFVVSKKKETKSATEHLTSLKDADLSAAFSAGLSRRIGRAAKLRVTIDRLSLATYGASPRRVNVRKAGSRAVFFPAFQLPMTLEGPDRDLAAAFFAGLGEKTRYGFGCPCLPL